MKKFIRSRKGFTLVEMLIVIAIIVILGGVTIVGIRAMIENSKKNAAAVELHAGCWYIEDPNGIETMMGGTMKKIRVVDRNTPGAQYYSDMDDMFDDCTSLITLNLSGWDFSKDSSELKYHLDLPSSLVRIDLSNAKFA